VVVSNPQDWYVYHRGLVTVSLIGVETRGLEKALRKALTSAQERDVEFAMVPVMCCAMPDQAILHSDSAVMVARFLTWAAMVSLGFRISPQV
jgi:hypothetical protein